MNSANIAELRSRLVAATDYSEFHDYCVTNFFENEGFRRLGRPLRAPQVDQMVRVCLELYLGGPPKKAMAIQANLTEIPEFRFIYGFLSMAGKLSST